MNFLKKIRQTCNQRVEQFFPSQQKHKQQKQQNAFSIVESNSLHMTIIDDEDNQQNYDLEPLTPEEWVLVLDNGNMEGFSFERIYFSFLKGIPEYLRCKIWLFFSSENSSKHFRFTAKQVPAQVMAKYGPLHKQQNGQEYISIGAITTELYEQLCRLQPLEVQRIQINKDVHRTYSLKHQYDYTAELLRKVLLALSNSGIEYSQGMNYILLNVIIYVLDSIGIKNAQLFMAVNSQIQKNIFVIMRQIIIRMDTVFGNNNIFKVVAQLEQKIAETVPEVLYLIYKLGMDCFSMFSQHYFSLLSYNDSTPQLNQLMMDLFFVVGEKAIHAIIVQMMQVSKHKILACKSPEQLNVILKKQLFMEYANVLAKQRNQAKKLQDFGLSFYENTSNQK